MKLMTLIIIFLIAQGLNAADFKPCDGQQLTAESVYGSRLEGRVTHEGNVRYCDQNIALQSDLLTIQQKSQKVSMSASGSPVKIQQQSDELVFWATANQVNYQPDLNTLSLSLKVHLNLKSNTQSFSIDSETLSYQFNSDNAQLAPASIKASGTPLTLSLNNSEPSSTPINATADELTYFHDSGELVLTGNVQFQQADDLIRAEKFIYNTQSKTWEAPAMKDKRIEIIRTQDQ